MGYNKANDPYQYVKALDFFRDLDNGTTKYERIKNVDLEPSQFDSQKNVIHEACYNGLAFRDDKGKIFIIQFARPTTFRVLFHPENTTLDAYNKGNSRNIVQDTFKDLVDTLDKFENTDWEVGYDTQSYPGYIVIESRPKTPSGPSSGGLDKNYYCRIFVSKKPFQIVALRRINVYNTREEGLLQGANVLSVDTTPTEKVIWQTKQSGILYSGKMALFEVEKPPSARYLGFGEQGGRQVLKSKMICDFFNFDNMTYSQVYNKGPLDSHEPLYHSEPFWMEIAQHPGYQLKLATFIDNLSQVCLDIGSKNNGAMRVASRFGCMRMYVVAGDSISKLINSYTAIVGRPQLKPRYVLGYHQACYGYDNEGWVREVVRRYREIGFPLDGMHIDVDFQRGYRTFTIDEKTFPNPKALLGDLRNQGVKCSTNITPFINNANDGIDYPTLREGLDKKYFIKDKRHTAEDGPQHPGEDRYMVYSSGNREEWNADDKNREPKNKYTPPDTQELAVTWNTGEPFRGGVYYGANLGNPGHYPDLNRKEVRRWWGHQYQYLIDCGLEFVWQDMTSPCIGAAYGDMKSIPFRLLITSDEHKGTDSRAADEAELPALQVWSLYSLNLHKATYHGWNHNAGRKGKRNYIIGRGGFIGLHRYAGLWTGDNASTWDFLRVSCTQVLALGLSGITISGGDVGGFEPDGNGKWANPELMMRWYMAYCLLPWFRNHYNRKMDKKEFQEPYRFKDVIDRVPADQQWLYRATLPVCQYYVRLRYSLLQLMYDQMFDNLLTGLPIARSLVISNEDDGSLVTENEDFLDDTYTCGDDILVAPVLGPQIVQGRPDNETRMIYLPRPDSWWHFNLRADGPDASVPLGSRFEGGTIMPYDARMSDNEPQIPYMNPMFIRYGAIIPQIEPRMYAEDWSKPNPISIHVYPGRIGFNKSYDMYLDDGVSRESAPTADNLQKHFAENVAFNAGEGSKTIKSPLKPHAFGDREAGNVFWRVRILQETKQPAQTVHREIYLETLDYSPNFDPTKQHGPNYRLFIWGHPDFKDQVRNASVKIFTLQNPKSPVEKQVNKWYDEGKNAWILELPINEVQQVKHQIHLEY